MVPPLLQNPFSLERPLIHSSRVAVLFSTVYC
jgi:hypothetical protein